MSYIYNKEDFLNVEATSLVALEPSFFKYNKDLGLLLCSTCSLAILNTKGLKEHLQKKHSSTKVSKESLEALESISIISYLDTTRLPDNTYFFKDLPIILKGFTCFKCPFLTTSYKKIREHLIKVEGIRGESTKKRTDISTTPIQILYPSLSKGLFIPKLPILGISKPLKAKELPSSLNTRESTSSSSRSSSTSSSIKEGPSFSNNLYLDYKTKKEELFNKALEVGESTISSKSLSSFLKNSRFNIFLEGRNIKALLELIEPISKEEVLLDSIYTISYNLSYKISTLIPNILRFIRIDIRKDNSIGNFLNTKDFIELESNTKKTYFKVFSNLFVFITRLYLIDNNLKTSSNKDYIRTEINLTLALKNSIKELISKVNNYTLEYKDKAVLKDIEDSIVYIFLELLKTPIKLTTVTEFNLFRDPTIIFFILNSLDSSNLIFKDIRDISKLASIIIYNTRLYTIGYLRILEEKNDEDTYDLEEEYFSISNTYLKSTSKNYLGEIINIRNYTLKISKELVSKNRPILEIDSNRLLVYNKEYSITSLSTYTWKTWYRGDSTKFFCMEGTKFF